MKLSKHHQMLHEKTLSGRDEPVELCPICETLKVENQRLVEELAKAQQEIVDLLLMHRGNR